MAQTELPYHIGTAGKKWGPGERARWLQEQSIKRSYNEEVLARIKPLQDRFQMEQYGALSYDPARYPLFALRTQGWDRSRQSVLVTGGVHGYETSGVQGAIRFLETRALPYAANFNIMVAPCISPWAYESINRWNPNAVDPNRSFYRDSPCEEAAALMRYIAAQDLEFTLHIDLHETTDTDNTEFRPALAARDGEEPNPWEHIPDGFYLVADASNPQPEFQQQIIRAVETITHIAAPDDHGKIIGEPEQQRGVVHFAVQDLGLCAGFSGASYSTTTEVYPDSPRVDDENCILAQVTAVAAGLDFLMAHPY